MLNMVKTKSWRYSAIQNFRSGKWWAGPEFLALGHRLWDTVHNGASKKVSQSKILLRAHFWSNYVQTFFGWCKITQILCQVVFFVEKVKYWVYFLDLSVK